VILLKGKDITPVHGSRILLLTQRWRKTPLSKIKRSSSFWRRLEIGKKDGSPFLTGELFYLW